MARVEIRPQTAQTRFLSSSADIAIYGGGAGGGKTFALLMEPIRHIKNPLFGCTIFRRVSPEITNQGGLWDSSRQVYPSLKAKPKELEWTFPSGARVRFSHLQYDDTVLNFQGSEIPLICFDELSHFSEYQFWYMLSRNRSTCGVRPYIRATTNPDADSWVAKLLEWWIDQKTGYAIQERSGVVRWFVRLNDTIVWGDSQEELLGKYPDLPPKSLTFIRALLTDNPIFMAADPGYRANLMALPFVERERLLGGNWKVRPADGIFKREWFRYYSRHGDYYMLGGRSLLPMHCTRFAIVDLATSTKTAADSTVITVWDDDRSGNLVLVDVVRGKWEAPTVVAELWKVQRRWKPSFFGVEGTGYQLSMVQQLAKDGLPVRRLVPNGDKVSRAMTASVRLERGQVWFPENAVWLSDFEAELLNFPNGQHDDQVDCVSYACEEMTRIYEMNKASKPFRANGMPAI